MPLKYYFNKRFRMLLPLLFCLLPALIAAQSNPEIPLWPEGSVELNPDGGPERVRIADGSGDRVVTNIHRPTITPYLPSQKSATGAAMIVAPGGGHRELWMDHEGYNIARWLSERGIAAFVIKYRLEKAEGSTYSVDEHSVKDMQRAIQMVRSRAAEWEIDPNRLGIMGFSAGGEVVELTDMHADDGDSNTADSVDSYSSKPTFHALIYPGRSVRYEPSERSSPVFIACGFKDRDDISKGMPGLYLKYKELGVPAELHIFANAGHGFGYREGRSGAASRWLERLQEWMDDQGYLNH